MEMPANRDPKEALDHVVYEMEMMWHSLKAHPHVKEGFAANMALESIIMHARNLDEFFRVKTPKHDNMRVRDFVKDFPLLTGGTSQLEKMNVDVAHLSYHRRRPGDLLRAGWNLRALVRPLMEKSVAFLAHMMKEEVVMLAYNNRERCSSLLAAYESELRAPLLDLSPHATTAYTGTTAMTLEAKEASIGWTGPADTTTKEQMDNYLIRGSTSQAPIPPAENNIL
jgi:hypothetical protein